MPARSYTLRHSLRLIFALGWADFVLKYRGTTFGYLWSLMAPLTKFLAILYVLGPFVGASTPLYPLYLFLGLIIWEHFVQTTVSCMTMLTHKAGLIQKIAFPRIILMFAVGWTHLIIFATQFLIFLFFMIVLRIPFAWATLLMIVIVCQMTLLALGIGMILSSYCLRFKDIRHLWEVLLQVLFWLTPVAYPLSINGTVGRSAIAGMTHGALPLGLLHAFITLQPVSVILYDARRVLLYSSSGVPTALHLLAFTGVYAVIFLIGAALFVRRSRSFIQEF